MLTNLWKLEREGEGRYYVRLNPEGNEKIGLCIPGKILGGSGRWVVQVGGNQLPETFRSRIKAADHLVRRHFGI